MRIHDVVIVCLWISSCYFWSRVSSELDPNGVNVCTKAVVFNTTTVRQRIVSVEETQYFCKILVWRIQVTRLFYKYCLPDHREIVRRTFYRSEHYAAFKKVVQNVPVCCYGYLQEGSSCPAPECKDGCLYGNCTAPGVCTCDEGYTGSSCANKSDPCLKDNGGCEQSCDYAAGNQTCGCYVGYEVSSDDDKMCQDVNECESDNGGCSDICNNTAGSYTCSCPRGFQLDTDNKTCYDTNECSIDNGGCEHECRNSFGSFSCSCRPGFTLDNNGRTCSDINECEEKRPESDASIAGCHHGCTNTIGSFTCTCNAGFILQDDLESCADIDECLAGTSLCQQGCINTLGSYTCRCYEGYKQGADLYTCEVNS